MQITSSLTTTDLLDNLIDLKASTTEYLEQCRGMKLKVSIQSQEEQQIGGEPFIRRISKLYFDSVLSPVLYSVSYLVKRNLTAPEYDLLINDEIPMGRLFIAQNGAGAIEKRNIMVSREVDRNVAESLQINSSIFYRKTYDYWVGDREIGKILEFFNEESLERV